MSENPLDAVAGGATSFDLTPGAPTAHWQGGTTEPTLVRIRGAFIAQPRSGVAIAQGGVRETRSVAVLLAWKTQGQPTLDPMVSADLSNEGILYHGVFTFDTRDFAVPAAAAPVNPFFVNISGPGIAHWTIDVKAKRRVRNEQDRLVLSVRFRELFTSSNPPEATGVVDTSGRLWWGLRFLYRTHR